MRARELGLDLKGEPGPHNDVTDVWGVEVGYTTLISGSGRHVVGEGPVRTGVTAIHPRGAQGAPKAVFAAVHSLNGNGELTGGHWIAEHGHFRGPIVLTNSNAVGVARDTAVDWLTRRFPGAAFGWMPVVGETWDGWLSDIDGHHVRPEHVRAALESATRGPIEQGSVGGGTGMITYEFKSGNGSSSRVVDMSEGRYVIGVFLQANFGARDLLMVNGIPVGESLSQDRMFSADHGSCIGVVLTDAPLLPTQLGRLARRVALGLARTGFVSGAESGDIFLAASVANDGNVDTPGRTSVECLADDEMDPLLRATAFASEEAVLDSLLAAVPMTGIDDRTAPALEPRELLGVLAAEHRERARRMDRTWRMHMTGVQDSASSS
ncbi:P1 family peptidase [Lentzea sp. NPDC051208]|uniref:DmpA family aminopeptidase n=1 Tax=Lentzea sp. NPDC051208 TaxID=3154642 RepID=UPI0034423147